MHKRRSSFALCLLLLGACSGGSASSTPPHAGATGAAPGPQGGVRRADSGPACSGSGNVSVVAGGEFNYASGNASSILGGENNEACDFYSTIGGGYNNSVSGTAGADTGFEFIGAGYGNAIEGAATDSAIAGGYLNTVSGAYASIGAGANNTASAEWATVAGGNTNTASGNASNVSGGANNVASGPHATVLGGSRNTASAAQSLAAGFGSTAATAGAFVWSDDASGATALTSTLPNQFLARASGGFTFWTNAANTIGATLAPGSGAWASASDRSMKTNVIGVDDAEVLDRVGHLPINRWSYITERGVRHVGPMAQDFYAAFGVGADDRHITAIDEDGVALAAIKALRVQQREQIRTTARREASMEREIARLDTLVRRLAAAKIARE